MPTQTDMHNVSVYALARLTIVSFSSFFSLSLE